MSNKSLNTAIKQKNDEFYTLYEDIEEELKHYTEFLENKIIYCNCDNPEFSNFWKYFVNNFEKLKLNKVICTYISDKESYKTEYDGNKITKTKLKGNGDFRSDECIEILKECDIVITNPPFSLFREFVNQLMSKNKKFLIVGNINAVKYKDIFPYIKKNIIYIENNTIRKFILPDGRIKDDFGNIYWFIHLGIEKNIKKMELTKKYNSCDYSKYDNYDAINVDKVKDIPCDYYGFMGVPITYMLKHNPNQFEIIDTIKPILNKKNKFERIIIKRKR